MDEHFILTRMGIEGCRTRQGIFLTSGPSIGIKVQKQFHPVLTKVEMAKYIHLQK